MGPRKSQSKRAETRPQFSRRRSCLWDPLAIDFPDPDHSGDEERYLTFGVSRLNRLVAISHTQRAEKTGIISAHLMTRQERTI